MRKIMTFCVLICCYVAYSGMTYTVATELPFSEDEKTTQEVLKGKHLWQKNNCQACHQLYGLGGYMGPDLTNVISTKSAPFAKVWIQNGSRRMPDFDLTDTEIDSLIAFLTHVDRTGTSPVRNFESTWYGTVTPEG